MNRALLNTRVGTTNISLIIFSYNNAVWYVWNRVHQHHMRVWCTVRMVCEHVEVEWFCISRSMEQSSPQNFILHHQNANPSTAIPHTNTLPQHTSSCHWLPHRERRYMLALFVQANSRAYFFQLSTTGTRADKHTHTNIYTTGRDIHVRVVHTCCSLTFARVARTAVRSFTSAAQTHTALGTHYCTC